VFANLLLIDEINRASPKTQAALLECMQELQVTVDGVSYELAPPFMVMATQNPIEYEGTYPLPEAELDRFSLRISIGYPEFSDEAQMLIEQAEQTPLDELQPVASAEDVLRTIGAARSIYVEPSMAEYVTRLLRATRDDRRLFLGASPRAGITLAQGSEGPRSARGTGLHRARGRQKRRRPRTGTPVAAGARSTCCGARAGRARP
jgi:MoxR-like ATPase